MNRPFLCSLRSPLVMVLLAVVAGVATAVWTFGDAAHAQPSLTVSPPSGPCDATVEVRGSSFEPGAMIELNLARPHSEGAMGKLGSAIADAAGDFSLAVSLGALGCEAAALDTRADDPGEPKDLQMYASYQPRRPRLAAWAVYAYTTTNPSPDVVPAAPPDTGNAGDTSGARTFHPAAILALAAGGLLLALGAVSGLHDRRERALDCSGRCRRG
jgi:hypothetical protein